MHMFYPRKVYGALKAHLKARPMTVITGMRQTGKTTLVKKLLADIDSDNKLYIDLERLDSRELFSEKNYDAIIHTLTQRGLSFRRKAYIALDEIQLVKNIPSVLKYLYDTYDIKFIVTGSSSFYLKNLFGESMAGRKKIFELYPLDFGEFLIFKAVPYQRGALFETMFTPAEYERLHPYYEEYIAYGGFPAVALADTIDRKKDLLADLVSSYVTIDIKSLADFRNEKIVYALIKMLAARTGTRLDYAKLSRLAGVSAATVRNYIDFFEKTYLIARLPVLTKNADREIVKAQKIYFCDPGIIHILAQIGAGAQFENAVFSQLRGQGELRYFALKTGREIDFILDSRTALEVKEIPTTQDKTDSAKLAHLAGLKKSYLIGRYPAPLFRDYIWGGNIV